jgi:4-hydroxythreonine-4-phosphate dehydrogenase
VPPRSHEPARRVRLAITPGDPRGIGPEVCAAACRQFSADAADGERPELILVGAAGTGAEAAADGFRAVGAWRAGGDAAEAGRLTGEAVRAAVALILAGEADALVTGPADKSALHAGGFCYPGHTELLAELAGVPAVAMLMAAERTRLGGALRVCLATTHIPLARVPGAVTAELLASQARLVHRGLRRGWGIAAPRIAFCALNPHASDGGLFGDEEARVFRPCIDGLRAEGLRAVGPFPADTVFLRAIRGEFDAVVAPYHDVGMAAFKTASFGGGVNVTLGLPFPRTAPDHGTAPELVGRALADPSSMLEALRLAARLAPRPTRTDLRMP